MKKKQPILVFLAIMAIVVCGLFCGCADDEVKQQPVAQREMLMLNQETTSVVVYYTSTDKQWLVPLTIQVKATLEAARVAVEKLLAGAPNDFVGAPLPADTKLKDLYAMGDIVYLDLTGEFYNLKPQDALLAQQALAATILPLWQGNKLQLLVDGEVCRDIGEARFSQPFAFEAVNELQDIAEDDVVITYYLGDQQAMYLVPQSKSAADKNKAEDLAYLAQQTVNAMLKQPAKSSKLLCPFWPGTRLLAVSLDNSVVTVDFSDELIGYGGGTAAEMMLVNSLVYSLTQIDGIDGVQILIEGQKAEYLPEGTDISDVIYPAGGLNAVG